MSRFTRVSQHLTVMHHDFVEGTCSIVTGANRTLIIDAGAFPAHAQDLADHILERGLHADVLGLTHGHGDHVAGVVELDPVTDVIAHPGALTRALQAAGRISRWVERDIPEVAGILSARLASARLADSFDLGGVIVEVMATPGHTSDSVCFVVDGVLVAGDTVVTNIPPAFADGDSADLTASFNVLARRSWRGLVPGHGDVIEDDAGTADWINSQLGYLKQLRATAEALLADRPAFRLVDELVSSVRLDGLPDTDDIRRRLRNNAKAMISELLART